MARSWLERLILRGSFQSTVEIIDKDQPHVGLHEVRNISAVIDRNFPFIMQPFTRLPSLLAFSTVQSLLEHT